MEPEQGTCRTVYRQDIIGAIIFILSITTNQQSTLVLSNPVGVTAGYGDEVIFADGTFIDGSTAEVSADGPMRPPYVVYCQV